MQGAYQRDCGCLLTGQLCVLTRRSLDPTIPRLGLRGRAEIINGKLDVDALFQARLGFGLHQPVGPVVVVVVLVLVVVVVVRILVGIVLVDRLRFGRARIGAIGMVLEGILAWSPDGSFAVPGDGWFRGDCRDQRTWLSGADRNKNSMAVPFSDASLRGRPRPRLGPGGGLGVADSGYLRGRPRFLFSPVPGVCWESVSQRCFIDHRPEEGTGQTFGSSESGSDDFRFLGGMVLVDSSRGTIENERGRQEGAMQACE